MKYLMEVDAETMDKLVLESLRDLLRSSLQYPWHDDPKMDEADCKAILHVINMFEIINEQSTMEDYVC